MSALARLLQESLPTESEEYLDELRGVVQQMLEDHFDQWFIEDVDYVEPIPDTQSADETK